ncbi:DUF4368 domain-containing protein [Neobacillus sp. PS3-12]|uniref:DUF4368 domain-containing protein n=1 Tax=Neobacillus sp. PS3-12 TaxID=3070677 RepID=UPI0027E0C285|nr:DUF4368 domain-containing protein [Neobacillus sp. PS3-12]WML50881.1 DUF4368 domain-containing protein [Neobacillus sp. PS3-12]
MLADKAITQDDYLEIIEDNNNELAQLVKKKNEMLSVLESEEVINNLDKLKQELLHFLNFDELTPEILHRLINRIEVVDDGTPPSSTIDSRPQHLNRSRFKPLLGSCFFF